LTPGNRFPELVPVPLRLPQRMLVRIDCEHRERERQGAVGFLPLAPLPCDRERVAAGRADLTSHGVARLIIRLEEADAWDQGKLQVFPRAADTAFLFNRLRPRIHGIEDFHARRDVSARHNAKRRRHRQSFEMDAWIISALIETPNTDTTPLHWKEGGYIGDSTDVGSWQ